MKSLFSSIFVFSLCNNLHSQNLAPNPSFETYTSCPTTLDQINRATGWSSFSITPDYYNVCNGAGGLGVPSNGIGFQAAASGVAYGGLVAYDNGSFSREIIGGMLTQNFIIGQKYYISVRISLAEFDATSAGFVPCDKMGVKFSTISYSSSAPVPINNFAHLYSGAIISDTATWTTISGSFIADSAYQYIMIGNFFDDLNTDTISRPTGTRSYFFIDDVCVSLDSMTCCCAIFTDYREMEANDVIVYPNPANDVLYLKAEDDKKQSVSIFNSLGQIVLTLEFTRNVEIDLTPFPDGLYIVFTESKEKSPTQKIIINHH